MTEKTKRILNDAALIESQRAGFERLKNHFDSDAVGPFLLSGEVGRHAGSLACPDQDVTYHNDPEAALELAFEDLSSRIESTRALRSKLFIPAVVEADFYGVHLVDKIFGADVYYNKEARQWYNSYLTTEIGTLERPNLDASEPWRQVTDYAKAFLKADVALPVLGMPVLSSALNIAVNLYGAEILVAMLEEPEAAKHDLGIINDTIIEMHRWYIAHVPEERRQPTVGPWRTQPYGFGQICGCSTHLVSPDMYEEFILPLDDAVLAQYPNGGMIHLCGNHSRLVPLFAKMPHLRSVQLNDLASDHLKYYVDGLRKDQVIYFSPTKDMTIEKSLEISKNKKMVYVGNFDI